MVDNFPQNKLTICTVSFKQKYLIEANIELVKKMNPGIFFKWVITENTPEGEFGGFELSGGGDDFSVVRRIPNDFKGVASASYHHASGLNKAIEKADTRYVLIIDPDFYIVRKNWIKDILSHMKQNDLAFFGAPYNPKRYMKYRNFPCIHCIFIDLEKVDKKDIDFMPRYDQIALLENRNKILGSEKPRIKIFYNFINSVKNHARIILKRKTVIGFSRDTGYKLYENFYNKDGIKRECVNTVFKFESVKPKYITSWWNRILENFLPQNLSYLPKSFYCYTKIGFKDLGYPDVFAKGWDEFVWRGKPFGFHMQGAQKDGTLRDRAEDMPELLKIFDFFISEERDTTLFITMFEGVESKNILRTGIVCQILEKNPFVRVVLFVKNKERADYYAKEFFDPRIVYEVVEPREIKGIDRFFSLRKFLFLQTETTDLRAKMIAEEHGQFYYYYSIFIHRLLARPFFIKIFRFLDKLLVRDKVFDKYFEKYKPDLILLANLFDDFEANFLRAAKRNKVFSVGLINSWDKVTARCILRILPDKLIVFNDTLKEEIIKTNIVAADDIFVSGIPQYDAYFKEINISKEDFFKKLGLDLKDKVIVYSPIGGMFSNSDWDILDWLLAMNKEEKFGSHVKILVRFPPNDFIKDEDLKKRPGLLYQYPGTRFSATRSTDWDMNSEELNDLKNTLFYMDLMICYASSISVDAVIFDKPVININFEINNNQSLSKSPTIFYKMTHYKKALIARGIKLVNNKEELVFWVKEYLKNLKLDRKERKRLTREQCEYTDGKSAERIANFLLDMF